MSALPGGPAAALRRFLHAGTRAATGLLTMLLVLGAARAHGATPTVTSLVSAPNPSFNSAPNDRVTCVATVTATGNPVGTGSVTFSEGATTLTANVPVDTLGHASFTTSALAEGVHVLTARFNGTAAYLASTGSVTATVLTHTITTGSSYCNPSPIIIADGGVAVAYPSRIFVKNIFGALAGFTLTLSGLTHPAPADLDVLLVGPSGEKFLLMADAGGLTAANAVTLTLDDTAPDALPPSGGLTTGRWRPAAFNSLSMPAPAPASPYLAAAPVGSSTLDSAIGAQALGTWSLYVADDSFGNGGGSFAGGWCINFDPAIVSVEPLTVSGTTLSRPWPSPTRGAVMLRYALVLAGRVQLELIDATGRRVRVLRSGDEPAGSHETVWDGRDDAGREVAAGMYFACLRAGDTFSVQRVVRVE